MTDEPHPAPESMLMQATRGAVRVLTLDRPAARNALCNQLIDELDTALRESDRDPSIRCVVLTGQDGNFAAGADIREMHQKSFLDVFLGDFITSGWETAASIRTPVIAAVAGHALGGGAELAMLCDMIIAAESASFGLPETALGIIPGAGGTQRLTRAVGKSVAMDMILTGRRIGAAEALTMGLVARVVPDGELLAVAVEAANAIASRSLPAILMAKEAVNRSYESALSDGIAFERRLFHSLFATEGQKEGMSAFLEKRPPRTSSRPVPS
jgi:enoyl-CoA hydratase